MKRLGGIVSILCHIFGHKIIVTKQVRGTIKMGTRLIYCPRCKHKFVMNDQNQAFLRYDHDLHFMSDLLNIYPELKESDL